MREEIQGGRQRHAEECRRIVPVCHSLLKPAVSNICSAKVSLKCVPTDPEVRPVPLPTTFRRYSKIKLAHGHSDH